MALQVENYNYTKELENKSSPQYKAIEKNFTEEVWFVFLLPSFHSLSPHSFFFSSAPHFLLSSPILPPSFSFFLCSLFFPPVISSFLFHSPPTFHSLSFFSLSLFLLSPSALPSLFLFPSHSSPSFVSPSDTLPFLPPSPSLQSFLLPSSFSEFFPSSPQSVRTTYSTKCLNKRLSPYMSPRQ